MEERLKELRKVLGLNQSEFADKLNLGQSTWAMIEVGKRALNDRHILLICSIFNVNETWLRTGEGDMFVKLSREDELVSWAGKLLHPDNDGSFQQRFVHMLSKLSVEDWKVLEKMAVLMAEENKED